MISAKCKIKMTRRNWPADFCILRFALIILHFRRLIHTLAVLHGNEARSEHLRYIMPKGSLSPFTAFYGVAIEMARRRHMRYGRMPTLVELIALLGVVGFLLALCLPSSSERVAAAIVRRSEHFQPGAQDRQRPSEALVATNVDVTGVWSVRRRLQRSSLEITGHRSGDLDVAFSTGGCLGSCRLARKGIFADGALTLNAAVAEYLGVEYQTLFAVRVEGQDYLVPAPFVDEFQRGLSSDLQSVVDRPAIDFYAYRRDPGN